MEGALPSQRGMDERGMDGWIVDMVGWKKGWMDGWIVGY